MHGRIRFLGAVVTTLNTRKTGHQYGEKTGLLSLVQQKTNKKEHSRDSERHQSRCSILRPRALIQTSHLQHIEDRTLAKMPGVTRTSPTTAAMRGTSSSSLII
ncbi:hypothetical protein TNCV_2625811 [Trichonephila clavipes]|nr:hypothetical protein TNCV_2625811 [Trichonephila clavipes]